MLLIFAIVTLSGFSLIGGVLLVMARLWEKAEADDQPWEMANSDYPSPLNQDLFSSDRDLATPPEVAHS